MSKLLYACFILFYIMINYFLVNLIPLEAIAEDIEFRVFVSFLSAGFLTYFRRIYLKHVFLNFTLVFIFIHNLVLWSYSNQIDYLILENIHCSSQVNEMFYCKDNRTSGNNANYFLSQMQTAGFSVKSKASGLPDTEIDEECLLQKKDEPLFYYWFRSAKTHSEKLKNQISRLSSLNFYEYLLQQAKVFGDYLYIISDFSKEKREYRKIWVSADSYDYLKKLLQGKLNIKSFHIVPINGSCSDNSSLIEKDKYQRQKRIKSYCESVVKIDRHSNKLKDLYDEYGFHPMRVDTRICDQHARKALLIDFCLDDLKHYKKDISKLARVENLISNGKQNSLSPGIRSIKKMGLEQLARDTESFLYYEAFTEMDYNEKHQDQFPEGYFKEKLEKGIRNASSMF